MTIPGRIINNRGLGVRGGHAMPGPGYFTPQQWATLSHDQRDWVLIQRGTKRKVSAILTDYNQGVFDNYEDLQENGLDHDQSFANGEYNFLDADYYDNGLPDTDEPADQYQHHGGSAGNEFGQHSRMKTSDDDFRYIGMFQTSTWYEHTDSHPELRAISKLNTIEMHVGHLELDSHADTYTAGKKQGFSVTATKCVKYHHIILSTKPSLIYL
jgi:hypothetical protein